MGKNNLEESEVKDMSLDVALTTDDLSYYGRKEEVFSANITHNLIDMADVAGIYEAVWQPEENEITHAEQLIPILEQGIAELEAYPSKYRALDAPNGRGTYDDFLPWLRKYLAACKEYPMASVSVSRL